jgi:C1A family cysteine protease
VSLVVNPSKRHHKDSGGVLRHMRGYRRDRHMPEGHDRMMLVSPTAMPLPRAVMSAQIKNVPLLDQGREGACTGFSGVTMMMHELRKMGNSAILSPQDLYKRTRMDEGTPLEEDSGAEVRDTVEAAHIYGVCQESLDPYKDDAAHYSAPITDAQAQDALKHKIRLSVRCSTLAAIKHSIAQGCTVQFGFTCFESLMSQQAAATGEIPYPERGEQSIGGHAMLIVGYDDDRSVAGELGALVVRQSWGSWGATFDKIKGYGFLPYRYVNVGLASDFHSARLMDVNA